MAEPSYWFSPAASDLISSRISLDFGLRAADLFFRELVVPELGRTWFVRQFSWPLAALALHNWMRAQGSNPPKPTAICHGIESLACKLEYSVNPDDPSSRILGRRAFARDTDSDIWSFERLRQPAHYVRNTHRQAATRAIRVDGGIGFATGVRFDLLQLEPVGNAMAEAFLEQKFGKGGTSLRRWLVGWIRGEKDLPGWSSTLMEALSPEHPTASEQALVRSRVLETSTTGCVTRQRLARAIGKAAEFPDIEAVVVPRLRAAGLKKQADEVLAARAFGAMIDRARDAAAPSARGRSRWPAESTRTSPAGRHPLGNATVHSGSFQPAPRIAVGPGRAEPSRQGRTQPARIVSSSHSVPCGVEPGNLRAADRPSGS
jgi:hypothetical protein